MKKQQTYQDLESGYDSSMDYLGDWIFHYNSFNDQWAAIPRNVYNEYWSNYKHSDVLRSKHLNVLLDLLHKSKGDRGVIEDLTSGQVK